MTTTGRGPRICVGAFWLLGACTAGVDPANGLTFGPAPTVGAGATTDADDDDSAETERDASTGASQSQGGEESSAGDGPATVSATGSGSSGETTWTPTTTDPPTCAPGQTADCYSGPPNTENQGECVSGVQTCDGAGGWGPCEGEVLPAVETCNGLDDDCNSVADDGDPDGGAACATGLFGPCQSGTEVCGAGGSLDCEPDTQPAPSETCGNAIDDDCNGTPDDGCVCDPLNPAAVCGAGNHCVPAADGNPLCVGPIGTGVQYTTCLTSAECAGPYECIATGIGPNYCMQWCTSDFDCPIVTDSCLGLTPPVGVGPTQWGVCYDGLP